MGLFLGKIANIVNNVYLLKVTNCYGGEATFMHILETKYQIKIIKRGVYRSNYYFAISKDDTLFQSLIDILKKPANMRGFAGNIETVSDQLKEKIFTEMSS